MRRTGARKPAVTGATSLADDEVWLRLYEKEALGGRFLPQWTHCWLSNC